MNRRGSPIRFLVLVLSGWVMLRAVMLWSQSTAPDQEFAIAARRDPLPILSEQIRHAPAPQFAAAAGSAIAPPVALPIQPAGVGVDPQRVALALLGMIRFGVTDAAPPVVAAPPMVPATPVPWSTIGPANTPMSPRWSGSFWLIAREGRGRGVSLLGSQLGGSQTGMRLAYALGQARRVAIVGRIASPLSGTGQEGAIGLEWRPTPLPVRLVAEQRIGIKGAAGGPSLAMVGGAGPLPLGRGFRLEGYGQAGIIARGGVIGYADGGVRINRQIAMIGDSPVDLGAGGWGAVQPGAARLDLGPSIGARLPIGPNRLRLSLDWRQRLAGDARPGSGPALSIGTDF